MKVIHDHRLAESIMVNYGIDSWKGSEEAIYLSWDDKCIFSVIPFRDGFEIHMAMKKDDRKLCRDAGRSFIEIFGSFNLYAPILKDRFSVMNLAKKMGFLYLADVISDNGNNVSIYVRTPNGRHDR